MENHMKLGITIDFFGLPGSGKTTIAHRLAGALAAYGYETRETIYLINNEYSSGWRIVVKMWAALCFTIRHFAYMRDLFAMVGKGAFLTSGEAIKQWVNICFVIASINRGHSQVCSIADQGIAQAALSLTVHCENADVVKIVSKLNEKIRRPVRYVYVTINIDKVLGRLESRINGKYRIVNEKSREGKIMHLQRMQAQCNKIAQAFDCIVIDNNQTNHMEADNFNDIMNKILDFIKSPAPSNYSGE